MLLSCNEFQWFCVAFFTNQAQPPNCYSESPRLSQTSPKCCYGRGAASVSWKLMGRETLHTQWFPHHFYAGDIFRASFVPTWAAHCGPCRLAKRYACAAKSLAVLLGVFVDHPLRTPQIAKTLINVSSNRLRLNGFGALK